MGRDIGSETGACPIPPLSRRKNRFPENLGTVIMTVSFSAIILSNLVVIAVPPLVLPPAFSIPQAPPGTNLLLARADLNGNLQWSRSFGGLDRDIGYTAIECYQGGFAVAGSTQSYGLGSSSMWLLRTNSTGHPIWNQTYGGTDWDECYDLVECRDGGFAIIGDTLSFGQGHKDVILVRTDVLGKEVWMKTFGGVDDDVGLCIIRCGTTGFTISGTTSSFGAGSSDMWLIRVDASGTLMWNKTFGEDYADESNSATLCSDGGFLLMGSKQFGSGSQHLWLVRTDSNGNELWNTVFAGSGSQAWSAVECNDGGFAVIGTDEDYGDLEDIIFIRVDSNGTLLWTREFGGSAVTDSYAGYSVIACDDGGFIIGGKFGFRDSGNDVWIARTDSEGEIMWSANYQGFHTGSGFFLGECSDNGIIITAGIETQESPAMFNQVAVSEVNCAIRKSRKSFVITREYVT